jgi:hypothetical protein
MMRQGIDPVTNWKRGIDGCDIELRLRWMSASGKVFLWCRATPVDEHYVPILKP